MMATQDVIVFPVKSSDLGDRSHPDEMSGGDLDGDQFWLCWDPRLVNKVTPVNTAYAPDTFESV